MANILSSAFWADAPADSPLSYDALQARRKIAEGLLSKRSPFPKTLGEGLTYAGERFYDAAMERDLTNREAARTAALGQEATNAYRPTTTADNEPADETAPASAPIRTAALTPSAATSEPATPNPVRDSIAQAIAAPRAGGGRLGLDQSVEFGSGPVAPAGPVGNAPSRFGPSITNPATGATLAVPEQPPPNRFSTAFGPLPNVPNVVAQPNTPDFVPTTAPQRMAALTGGGASPTMTDIPSAPPGAAPAARINDAFSAIPSAPPAPQQAAPPQTASQDAYQPIVPRPPTEAVELYVPDPKPPRPTPQSQRELQALQRMAAFPGDPDVQRIWLPIAQQEAAARTFKDKILDQQYQAQLGRVTTAKAANQVAARAAAEKELELRGKEYELPRVPAGQTSPVVNTPYGLVDQRWGTAASPQRIGIPTPEPNPGVPAKLWDTAQAKKIEADMATGEKATPIFGRMVRHIQEIADNPAVKSGDALGLIGKAKSLIPTTEAGALALRIDQIKNQAFLGVYQDILKGGGQISNIEGTKASAAQTRLNQATTPKEFRAALQDFGNAVREDYEAIQRRLNQPVTAWKTKPEDPVAPDKGQIVSDFEDGIPRRYLRGNPLDYDHSWEKLR